MAIIGTQINRTNPSYTKADFLVWFPSWKKYFATEEGEAMFNTMYEIANNKIYKCVWGSDWKMAMALCIAHYCYLVYMNNEEDGGDTLDTIAGGGATKGMLTSASVGGFSKGYSLEYTAVNLDDAKFWNQSSYGSQLMALYKTKPIASIFVVTNGPVQEHGHGNYFAGEKMLFPWRNRNNGT